jgi:hypothetical protein
VTGAKAHRKVSHLYFTPREAAMILLPLDKEPRSAVGLMRMQGRRGNPPPIPPGHPLWAPTQMRFLPEVVYATAIAAGSMDPDFFDATDEQWEQEVRLRFTAMEKPLDGKAPTPEQAQAAFAVLYERWHDNPPYKPRERAPYPDHHFCLDCQEWLPNEQFRRQTGKDKSGYKSYCRYHDNRHSQAARRERHRRRREGLE